MVPKEELSNGLSYFAEREQLVAKKSLLAYEDNWLLFNVAHIVL